MRASIDAAVASLERQIHKNKTRLEKQLHQNFRAQWTPPRRSPPSSPTSRRRNYKVVRTKTFAIKPMTRDEPFSR